LTDTLVAVDAPVPGEAVVLADTVPFDTASIDAVPPEETSGESIVLAVVITADVPSVAAGACAVTPPATPLRRHSARAAEIVVEATIAPGAGIRLLTKLPFQSKHTN
jgi:hypothetical protein